MPFYRSHMLVCNGAACVLKGSRAVQAALTEEIKAAGLESEVRVVDTGCLGISECGPAAVVYPEGTVYVNLTPADAKEIVQEHLLKGRVVGRLMYKGDVSMTGPETEVPFVAKQQKVVLKN